jgi:hypothetical protein
MRHSFSIRAVRSTPTGGRGRIPDPLYDEILDAYIESAEDKIVVEGTGKEHETLRQMLNSRLDDRNLRNTILVRAITLKATDIATPDYKGYKVGDKVVLLVKRTEKTPYISEKGIVKNPSKAEKAKTPKKPKGE